MAHRRMCTRRGRRAARRASYRARRATRVARRASRRASRRAAFRFYGGAQDDAMAMPEQAAAQYASPFVTNMVRY
jgi:hypothetical protein